MLDDSDSRCLTSELSRLELALRTRDQTLIEAGLEHSGTGLPAVPRTFNTPPRQCLQPAGVPNPAASIGAAAEIMWRADDGTPVPEDSRHRGMGDWKWCGPMARPVRPVKRGTSTAEAPIATSRDLGDPSRPGQQPKGIRGDAAPRSTADQVRSASSKLGLFTRLVLGFLQ